TLAEMPERWAHTLTRLLELTPLPDPGFGHLLWQAVIGVWSDDPALRTRLHAYAEKAMREAGDRTTWTAPDADYESAVHAAVDAAFDDPRVTAVLGEVLAAVTTAGWSNALAAKLVALTVPGVPDVYQGSELWEQSLVDPDNRRFVDFDTRAGLLDSLGGGPAASLTDSTDDPGVAKLAVTRAALTLRRDRPELFTSYAPVAAVGAAADHVLAFDRGGAVTVATRLPVGLAARDGWGTTTLQLPGGAWRDVITGATLTSSAEGLPVSEALGSLPVALLVKEER
ncbi:MAG TPA: malto-oligosyltrehalose synthase, partial [Nocardioides sp.]|nr:malto-oligosyltrehalose synthase [Nocardioides sp.]